MKDLICNIISYFFQLSAFDSFFAFPFFRGSWFFGSLRSRCIGRSRPYRFAEEDRRWWQEGLILGQTAEQFLLELDDVSQALKDFGAHRLGPSKRVYDFDEPVYGVKETAADDVLLNLTRNLKVLQGLL